MASLRVFLLIPLLSLLSVATMAEFKCSSNSTCNAIVDYVSPNTTTLSHIASFFQVSDLSSIIGVNSLPTTTNGSYSIPAQQKIKIPFPCLCRNGTGISNHKPIYTVVPQDGLYHIGTDVFSGLATVQDIATVNNIPDINKINIGQKLWIPLPCSCDEVGGEKVVHYGYVVPLGSSVAQIANDYGTTEATLLSLNGIAKASDLKAGQVLDVPLKACSSSVNSSSLDYPMLLANGTYVFTANNCVMCKCSAANNYTLQCQASGLQPSNWTTCPSTKCSGSSNLELGNSTSSSCNTTTCAYAGYTMNTILTTLDQESTCPVKNQASKASLFSQSLRPVTHVSSIPDFLPLFSILSQTRRRRQTPSYLHHPSSPRPQVASLGGTNIDPTVLGRQEKRSLVSLPCSVWMENNVSQSRSRAPNFIWNDELVRLLVKILNEYQKKNGSKQAYNWKDITITFTSKCGKTCMKEVCRNKYESMKKEYKAWNLLRHANTGLGWNESTRMITASNEWWDRKIKEDANCKKYRNKGMDVVYEELLSTLFAGNVATGRLVKSSDMVRETSHERVSLVAHEDVGLGEGVGADGQYLRTSIDTFNEEGASSHSGVGANLNDQPLKTTQVPTTALVTKVTNDKGSVKRKRRQSVGSSKFEEHLAHTRENSDKRVALFQEEVSSKEKEEEEMMNRGFEILDRLVEKNLVEDGSPLWCSIVSKTKSRKDMLIMLNLANDEQRTKWLKWEFENR